MRRFSGKNENMKDMTRFSMSDETDKSDETKKTDKTNITDKSEAKEKASVSTVSAAEALTAGVEGRRAAKFTFSSDALGGTDEDENAHAKKPNQKLGMAFAFVFAIVAAIVLAVFIAHVMALI